MHDGVAFNPQTLADTSAGLPEACEMGGPALAREQVTEVAGGYHCEQDSKTYSRMERRYVLLVKAADASGEAFLTLFNVQVRHRRIGRNNKFCSSKCHIHIRIYLRIFTYIYKQLFLHPVHSPGCPTPDLISNKGRACCEYYVAPRDVVIALSISKITPSNVPHHGSAFEHRSAVTAEVHKLVRSGALLELEADKLGLTLDEFDSYRRAINFLSLGYVIRASNGKGRMIWDCRCGNLYVTHLAGLKYDSIGMFMPASLHRRQPQLWAVCRQQASTSNCVHRQALKGVDRHRLY